MVVVFAGQRLRRIHREGQSWQCPSLKFEGRESFKLRPALCANLVRLLGLAWQDTFSQKCFDMAVKKWEGAQKDLEGAREDRDFARQRLRLAVQNRNQKEIKEATEAFNKAESKVDTAKEEAERAEKEAKKANEELEKAKSTAPLQAGGAFALLRVQGSCSPLSKDSARR